MDSNGDAWTLTLAQAPLAVGKRLARRNLEHRLFKLKVRRLRRGQMRDEVTPAFGRYVFTRVEARTPRGAPLGSGCLWLRP